MTGMSSSFFVVGDV